MEAGPAAGSPPPSSIFPIGGEPFPGPDGKAIGATVTWTGVAGFVLEAGGTRIAFDPFVTRPGLGDTLFRRARPDAGLVTRAFSGLDAVFVGHAHFDHAMDLPAVAVASPGAPIHGSRTLVDLCERLDVSRERLVPVVDAWVTTVGPFRVAAVRIEHGVVPVARWFDRVDLPPDGRPPCTPFRYPRGECFAWRVEVGGRAIHVQGSAGLDDFALARQRPCDVLIACLAARRGTPRYLARLAARLRPSVLVPCHHDDFFRPLSEPPRPIATLRWRDFLAEAAAVGRDHGTVVWLPPRGVPAAW
jgi:L-ascorbate metabolism protein UlaG (beta-lactamase superfamily)